MHHDTGARGESIVADFLRNKGCKIVGRNFRTPFGEIDIIVRQGSLLIFVEVKTLARANDFYPEMHFTKNKLFKMKRTITVYLKEKRIIDSDYRLDLVAVELDGQKQISDIRHYENITM